MNINNLSKIPLRLYKNKKIPNNLNNKEFSNNNNNKNNNNNYIKIESGLNTNQIFTTTTNIDSNQTNTKPNIYNINNNFDKYLSSLDYEIAQNNQKIQILKNFLQKIKNIKEEKKKIIQNNLSNKESLEFIYSNLINEIKKQTTINFIVPEIDIEITDIQQLNFEKFTKQVFNLNNELFEQISENDFTNNYQINMLNYFTEIIKTITELNENNKLTFSLKIEIVGNFISFICEFFLAPVYNNLNLDIIVQLVKYLTKINYIYNVIENDISFIKKEYKELKNEKKNEIKILEDKNLSLENQKNYYLEFNENKENNKNYENVNINDNNEIKIIKRKKRKKKKNI